jgi:hypothetical protein
MGAVTRADEHVAPQAGARWLVTTGGGQVLRWSLSVLLAASLLDAVTTRLLLVQPGHREMNPLARSLIDTFGLSGAVVVRVLFGVAYFLVLRWILCTQTNRVLRIATGAVAVGAAAWWWMVVVNNAVLIGR